ncbi:MAG TPA: hypothetical protein PLX89_04255 [Verrucomicrobiota bacterium]|nr:hypothetical protein [Verrucomicrobiota bacterium]
MRTALMSLALGIWGAALGLWLVGGANTGWTKTQEPVKTLDEVTGIEAIEWQKRFRAGIDLVGPAVLAGAVLAALSVWIGRKSVGPAKRG